MIQKFGNFPTSSDQQKCFTFAMNLSHGGNSAGSSMEAVDNIQTSDTSLKTNMEPKNEGLEDGSFSA